VRVDAAQIPKGVLDRKATARRFVFALVGVVGLAAGGGCSGDEGEVASLESPSESASESQAETAEAYLDCLVAAGLPATIEQMDEGLQVGWEQTGYNIFAITPDGENHFIPGVGMAYDDPAMAAAFEAFMTSHYTSLGYEYGLEIDGVDHSDTFKACREETGYVSPTGELADPAEEARARQLVAESTNVWVACARENGYPDMPDVAAGEADNWLTSPSVVIPLDTTPEELRGLLAVCPNFDPERAEAQESGEATGEVATDFQPVVVAETPPLGDTAAEAKYQELETILGEAEQAFYEERAESAAG
jgi:hypothetical protein